jgi:hypothetical protein
MRNWKIAALMIGAVTVLIFWQRQELQQRSASSQQDFSRQIPLAMNQKRNISGVGQNTPVTKSRPRVSPTPLERGQRPIDSLEDLQREFGPGWDVVEEIQGDSKRITSILVSETQEPILDKSNVADFVGRIRPLLGSPNAQIELIPKQVQENVFDFEQRLGDYAVYNARVRVMLNSDNSTPLVINNSLRPVEVVKEDANVSAEFARESIRTRYIQPAQPMKLVALQKPVVYQVNPSEAVLAWVVHAEWMSERGIQSRDFLVSTQNAEVLTIRNLVYR